MIEFVCVSVCLFREIIGEWNHHHPIITQILGQLCLFLFQDFAMHLLNMGLLSRICVYRTTEFSIIYFLDFAIHNCPYHGIGGQFRVWSLEIGDGPRLLKLPLLLGAAEISYSYHTNWVQAKFSHLFGHVKILDIYKKKYICM